MRQIRLILDTDTSSIGYCVDLEAGRYDCGSFNNNGAMPSPTDSGEIIDSTMLAKKLYLVIEAAMREAPAKQLTPVTTNLAEAKVVA